MINNLNEPQPEFDAQQLREAFTDLKRDQNDASNLFRSVLAGLAGCPTVGKSHELYKRWEGLQKDYHEKVEAARRNASKCATQLSQYSLVLPRILQGDVSLEDKKSVVALFLEEARKGRTKAFESEEQFRQVADSVGEFIDDFDRQNTTSWKASWHNLKTLCTRAFNLMKHIATCLGIVFSSIDPKKPVKDWSRTARTRIHIHEKNRRLDEDQPLYASEIAKPIADDCQRLERRMISVADAWNDINRSCEHLTTILALANKSLDRRVVDFFLRQLVGQATAAYGPLIEGLRAYSTNRTPDI